MTLLQRLHVHVLIYFQITITLVWPDTWPVILDWELLNLQNTCIRVYFSKYAS